MNIYLIRHGDSERAAGRKSDFDRELTEEGKQKILKAAKYWKNVVPGFDYIISSPLIRAKQTAEIIADTFHYKNDIVFDDSLRNGGDTKDILNLVNSLKAENIALVGHQPDFSYHVSILISNGTAEVDFKKGAIAKIAFEGKAKLSRGILEFLIPTGIFK